MPTGYTHDIEQGISFQQFAMNCARAFGACVLMRDEPADAPIPERIKVSDYYTKSLEEAREALSRVRSLTPEQAHAESLAAFKRAQERNTESLQKCRDLRAKYEAMLVKVNAWAPPTPDHKGMKQFMREQIEKSIEFDCNEDYYLNNAPTQLSADKWRAEQIRQCERDVEYREKALADEQRRTDERNAWLSELRASLAS
jgi:hypothetical protein